LPLPPYLRMSLTLSHLTHEELELGLRALPPAPKNAGAVAMVVVRPEVDSRRTPDRARLTPEAGLEGDRWGTRPSPNRENQVTLMWAGAARFFANGQPISLFGDNLLVELDLSEVNLPAGSLLRIGEALCEVTPLPHTGCGKFAARFGQAAREIMAAEEFAAQRLRGIHVRVLEAGDVCPGDAVQVLSRP
jgi:MOSC domain-containing protein YiiM